MATHSKQPEPSHVTENIWKRKGHSHELQWDTLMNNSSAVHAWNPLTTKYSNNSQCYDNTEQGQWALRRIVEEVVNIGFTVTVAKGTTLACLSFFENLMLQHCRNSLGMPPSCFEMTAIHTERFWRTRMSEFVYKELDSLTVLILTW